MIVLEEGDVRLELAPEHGGRVAQLTIGDTPVLAGHVPDAGPMSWGSFPMVPYVGRIRRGRLTFGGADYRLPVTLAPHAIHGTGYLQAWEITEHDDTAATMRCDLGTDWPFGGWAEQRFVLDDGQLVSTLGVHAADRAMPAQVGWHPWFVKPAEFDFAARAMFRRDADGIADGTLVEVPSGPWDDCFVGIRQPVTLRWPGLELAVESDCDTWVIYDQPESTTCVEPQSGAPDASNWQPEVIQPGGSLVRTMTWRWSRR